MNALKTKGGSKVISWTVRLWLMLLVAFFLLFSLDVFDMESGQSVGRMMLGFLMHNIPTLALLLILFITWRHEYMGGFLLVIAGVLMIYHFGGPKELFRDMRWLLIGTPIPMGILLLLNHFFFRPKSS